MKSFLETIYESSVDDKHHVMTFGRMNPPTTGHLKLIDKVKEVANKNNASHSVVTSHSQDAKKNPLSSEQKIKHLKRYSPGTNIVSSSKDHPTFLHHAAELHKKGVTHLHMVAGSDRVAEYKEKLHKYNGTHEGALYNFKKITVHSAGQRDPDAEGSEGMSGTKMREHAKNKDLKSFRQGVPSHVSDAHAKELMHDTRKGMGLHEDVNRGQFKAIFVTGGPGSGKDIIIREAISESRIAELNFIQAVDYLGDKQKLSEKSSNLRRESLRTRGPLIINGPADDLKTISYIKEELEELGYSTMMIFVNTTNDTSKERNSSLSRMMMESIRYDKWLKSQENTKVFTESFGKFVTFDNTGDLNSSEEDITDIYQTTNLFLNSNEINESAKDWLERNTLYDINRKVSSLFKEDKNVPSNSKSVQKINLLSKGCGKHARLLFDNNCPECQVARKSGKRDDVRDGDIASNSSYTFRTYESKTIAGSKTTKEEAQPTLKYPAQPKETNFQQDKDKTKRKIKGLSDSPNRAGRPSGVGAEYDTRTSGSGLTGGAGLGNQTYSEAALKIKLGRSTAGGQEFSSGQRGSAETDGARMGNNFVGEKKTFLSFRKKTEAIDDPGAVDMGVSGTLSGAGNKEPMVSYRDKDLSGILFKKKLKKQ